MKQLLNQYIDEHLEDMLAELAEFIAIPSVSSDLASVEKALDYVLDLAAKKGFTARKLLDGQIGVIEAGDGPETLGVLTHVDVVTPGDLTEWKTDPYQMTVADGNVYGRGTLDDKGMVLASLLAMEAVQSLGQPFRKKVQLIMGTQEESAWTDMDAYVKAFPLPDYGFTPDGEYPLCNIEKGSCDVTLQFDIADTAEGLHLTGIDCGIAHNVVPGKATATLSDGRQIVAAGKAVHSCQPERGENAFYLLVDVLEKEELVDNRLLRIARGLCEGCRDIFGKPLGLYSESEYYEGEFVHRNALSLTIAKTDGDKLEANINVRFPYGEEAQNIVDKLEAFGQTLGGEVIGVDTLPPVFVSQNRPFLKVCAEAYESVTGLANEFTLAYGGSYAKAMPNVVSWGPIFLGEEDTCHEANEYIPLESLKNNAKIFAQTIAGIVLSEESFN